MLKQNTSKGEAFLPMQPAQTGVKMGRSRPPKRLSYFTLPSPPPLNAAQDLHGSLGGSRLVASAVPRPARSFLLPPSPQQSTGNR